MTRLCSRGYGQAGTRSSYAMRHCPGRRITVKGKCLYPGPVSMHSRTAGTVPFLGIAVGDPLRGRHNYRNKKRIRSPDPGSAQNPERITPSRNHCPSLHNAVGIFQATLSAECALEREKGSVCPASSQLAQLTETPQRDSPSPRWMFRKRSCGRKRL